MIIAKAMLRVDASRCAVLLLDLFGNVRLFLLHNSVAAGGVHTVVRVFAQVLSYIACAGDVAD